MTIAPTLQRYLDQKVTYGVIPHEPTMSSMHTAQICQISGDCLAKGIVLRHEAATYSQSFRHRTTSACLN